MSDIAERIAKLTPAQRALLQRRVAETVTTPNGSQPIPRWESDQRDASFGQERLWFLEQIDGGTPLYNIAIALHFEGGLDVVAVRRTLDAVIRRHETLRTRYTSGDGLLRLDVTDDYTFELPITEIQRSADLEVALEAEARVPMALDRDLLLRARLFRLSADDHTLLVTMHHIASDGWSLAVFYRDFTALYNSAIDGVEPILPELQVSYSDYAHWMRDPAQSAALERLTASYVEKLRDAPVVLELPTDRPRPPLQTFVGRRRVCSLPQDEMLALRDLCKRERLTPFMAVLASLYALLHRYSGQSRILVGSAIAGRTRAETENLIGFFTNTLVLPGDLSGDPEFRTLLERTRDIALDAYAHQDVPFEQVIQRISHDRDLSRSSAFQVMFVLENAPVHSLELRGLVTSVRAIHTDTAKFDLSVHARETAIGMDVSIEYNADLFDAATIERFWQHLRNFMRTAFAKPELRISEIPLLGDAERHMILEEWNATALEYPRSESLSGLVEEQVRRSPESVAVVYGDELVTYLELNERANQLARELMKQGAAPGTLVGLCVERGIEMMIALLGIVKTGAAYVPLDPSLPAARISHALEDSGARLLVTSGAVFPAAASFAGAVIDLADGSWATNDTRDVNVDVPGDAPAYVIYTSGSTGKPKGVPVSHRSLLNLLWSAREKFQLGANDRVLATASISFDIAGVDVWLPWIAGATTVIASTESAMEGERLSELIERHDITFMQATPVTWRLLLDNGWKGKPGLQCVSTGEALSADVARNLIARTQKVWNMYGPTETTIWSTGSLVTDASQPINIGRPIGNTQCYILDARGEPQPIGVIGELCIGGDGVARGYVNQPDLTREKFVPDPYSTIAGARMYRTGDMARYRADGNIEFIGRTDQQVKIRGYRIELGEIESALVRHPCVKQAIVIAREDTPGDRILAAYVVPNGEPPSPTELRSYLRRDLPDYMVPSAYVMLDTMPVTATGKIDRNALQVPEQRAGGPESKPDRALTPMEAIVASIWKDVLKIDGIAVTDDFFAIGGHSLKATQVVTRLRTAVNPDIPIRLLFERPTIESLAAALTERGATPRSLSTAHIAAQIERESAPLSFSQEQLWLVEQLEPGNTAYIIGCTLRLSGAIDVEALQAALSEIVRRHGILRTAFVTRDGSPVQIVRPAQAVALPVTDLSALPEPSRSERMRAIEEDANRVPFDLMLGSPIRFQLATLGASDHRLLITAHHIAIDGWSLQILVREFFELYSAFRRGESSSLPELALQYADFAAWQRDDAMGEALENSLAYWRGRLAGAPALLQLPLDHPRPPVRTFHGAAESACIDEMIGHAIAALGQSEGATVFMTMAAAFQLLMSRMAGEDDIVIGIPVAGRTRIEAESMLGCFINTLPLRTRIDADQSFVQLLRDVRRSSIDAYAHQAAPFDLLVERLNPPRNLSHAPIFQVLFNVLNMPGARGELPGMRIERRVSSAANAKFDLTMYVDERPEGIHLRLVYSTELFSAARAAALLRQYIHLLEQIITEPGAPVGSYSLVAPRHAIVLPDPAEPLSASWEGSVAEVFGARAARGPERPAIVDGTITWTYRDLDERSSQLAHHLAALGARKGEVVAIYAQRSGSLVLALLSVLKTGAAFVVLDRAYPPARLVDYLEASGARIIVRLDEAGALPDLLQRFVGEMPGVSICEVPAFGHVNAKSWSQYPDTPPGVEIGSDDTAYIAFTSGTTGAPKGIVGRHGSLTHFTPWLADTFGLRADDRYSMLSGLAHDPLHRDVFTPLQLGASIHVPDAGAIYDPDRLARWMSDTGITIAHLTPALGQLVSSASPAPSLTHLRVAFFVGDALTRRDVDRLHAIAPNVQVVNYYGTTETQRAVSCYVVDRASADAGNGAPREIVPLGRGIPDVQLLVLTAGGRLAGIGEVGEIIVRSPHIAKGYLNDDHLTAERFVANPVTGDACDVCYRTGDLGRYDPDGNVVALGRADKQVKIRGFRVEPAEIEAVLGKHASVRESVVTSYADAAGETRLAAYVVPRESGVNADELRRFLKERLPSYMSLSSLMLLESLPLTPNGKIDRRALPVPNIDDSSKLASGAPPRGPVQEELCRIWAELLGVSPIGVDDDFFILGGHSLLAVAMMERVTALFGTRMPLSVLFEQPTVRHLGNTLIANAGLVEAHATCVQRGASGRTPLFLFHGDYMGGGLYCRKLVRYLDAEQPVYVIAPHMPGGRETVEEMASDALPHIRGIQPAGPYLVAGYCNGGMVALEVAQQLRASGEEVKFLAVIDIGAKNVQLATLYGVTKRVTGTLGFNRQRQLELLARLNEPALRFLRDDLPPLDRTSGPRARIAFAGAFGALVARRAVRHVWRAGLYAARLRAPEVRSWEAEIQAEMTPDDRVRRARSAHITRAMQTYVPRAYAGTITLIAAQDGRLGTDEEQLRHWRSVGRLNVVTIPGDHGSVVTSNIDGLGAALRAEMARLS